VPQPLSTFTDAIAEAFAQAALPGTKLWAEPGRALAAAGASVVVQMRRRRGDALFINDGVYGALSDAGVPAFRFPVRRVGDAEGAALVPFSFFGPTCDSADVMRGPFLLPADIAEGAWIEIGQLGAYGACLRTGFNGFDRAGMVEVDDQPILETPGHALLVAA